MKEYKIRVNALVLDEATGFEAGIDINVKNGQNIATVGQAVQTAIDIVSPMDKAIDPNEQ